MWLSQSDTTELLDRATHEPDVLRANLYDIARINRYFGGTGLILRYLRPLLPARGGTLTVLDIATGAGDIPLAIARLCKKRGIRVEITGIDRSPEVLEVARQYTGNHPAITFVEADAFDLPYAPESFDVVLCSLAFHHFGWGGSVRMLERMDCLARRGYIANDLVRSRLGYTGAWLLAHVITSNRYTRHDAPLSVARAFTPHEYRAMLRAVALPNLHLYLHPFFRAALVGYKAACRASSR